MSVLAKKNIVYFEAPLSISEHKVALAGSWSPTRKSKPMDGSHLLRMRLHVWRQQHQSNVSNVCLDWVCTHESGSVKHTLVIKFEHPSFEACLRDATFDAHIHSILDQTRVIWPISNVVNTHTQGSF